METQAATEETRTHWKALVDPRYFGAYALPNGNDLVVTIELVRSEEVTMMGGKKEVHSIMYLKGQKPMILNVTNSKSIHKLYGPYIEDWAGKQITLYASTAKMGGEMVECVRIRPSVPVRQKQSITDTRLDAAIQQIRAGTYTIAKLRGNFTLTEDQQTIVSDLEKELA
jgi:transcriptional regulator of met regulon